MTMITRDYNRRILYLPWIMLLLIQLSMVCIVTDTILRWNKTQIHSDPYVCFVDDELNVVRWQELADSGEWTIFHAIEHPVEVDKECNACCAAYCESPFTHFPEQLRMLAIVPATFSETDNKTSFYCSTACYRCKRRIQDMCFMPLEIKTLPSVAL